jgi:glutamine amidotransferase
VIAIIDYGRGNLGSVEKAFQRVGVPATVTQDPRVVEDAEAVVLPGDGAFHDAMANLDQLGLRAPLVRALDGRRPFLGICLGYQLLFSSSEEFGQGRGLDVIPGVVRRFPPGRKVPHMGWNRVHHGGGLRLFEGIPDGAHFYFVHSYYPVVAGAESPGTTEGGLSPVAGAPDARSTAGLSPVAGAPDARSTAGLSPVAGAPDARSTGSSASLRVAWCEYGVRFAAALERGRIFATQFHPEKSQRWGLRLLENFAAFVKSGG